MSTRPIDSFSTDHSNLPSLPPMPSFVLPSLPPMPSFVAPKPTSRPSSSTSSIPSLAVPPGRSEGRMKSITKPIAPHIPPRPSIPIPKLSGGTIPINPQIGKPQIGKPQMEKPQIGKPQIERSNPYLLLSSSMVQMIAQERDIQLSGDVKSRANQLHMLDQVMPEWIDSIQARTIDDIRTMQKHEVIVYGSLHGVNYSSIRPSKSTDIANYTLVSILLLQPSSDHHRMIIQTTMKELSRRILKEMASFLRIEKKHLTFLSKDNLIQSIINRRPIFDPDEINNFIKRTNILSTHPHSNLIRNLYHKHHNVTDWSKIAKLPIHPMEPILLNFSQLNLNDIQQNFGIMIPPSYLNDPREYILGNIISYSNILTRSPGIEAIPLEILGFCGLEEQVNHLRLFTDYEIINHFKIYVPYENRNFFIRNILECLNKEGFMIPVERLQDRAINTQTMMLTDITDKDVFMICFGTVFRHRFYELSELHNAFHLEPLTGTIAFRRPENINQTFSVSEIENLLELLRFCYPTPEILALISRINDGLIFIRDTLSSDINHAKEFQKFSQSDQKLIRQFLSQIFDTGMYMRKWKGPGHPYPLNKSDTIQNFDPDRIVGENLLICSETLKQMSQKANSYCMKLKACEYRKDGSIENGGTDFNSTWNGIIKGTSCIRMGSTKFIGTSMHYRRLLFQERVAGMNIGELDRIM